MVNATLIDLDDKIKLVYANQELKLEEITKTYGAPSGNDPPSAWAALWRREGLRGQPHDRNHLGMLYPFRIATCRCRVFSSSGLPLYA